jgi:hypothetical protein
MLPLIAPAYAVASVFDYKTTKVLPAAVAAKKRRTSRAKKKGTSELDAQDVRKSEQVAQLL